MQAYRLQDARPVRTSAALPRTIWPACPSRSGSCQYSPEHRRLAIQKHAEAVSTVSLLMQGPGDAPVPDTQRLVDVVREYQRLLRHDAACVLSAPLSPAEHHRAAVRAVETAVLAMALGVELELDESSIDALGLAALVGGRGEAAPEVSRLPAESVELLRQAALRRQTPWRSAAANSPAIAALYVAGRYVQFKSRRSPAGALRCVLRGPHGRGAEQAALRALVRVLSLFPLGSRVQLSDGRIGRVLRSNPDDFTCPVVQIVVDCAGNEVEADAELVDLTCCETRIVRALCD